MPPTPPIRPSTSLPKASLQKPQRRHRPYKPRQSKRHAITSEAEFIAAHKAADTRFRNYYVDNRKGSVRLSRAEFDQITPRDGMFLNAANATARINYVKIAAKHIKAKVGALAQSAPVAFTTLIEERFNVGLKEAANFDVESLQAWVRRRLPECSFIGMVEAALYTNNVVNAGMDRTVSWHAHVLVWGTTQKRLDALIAKANRRYKTLVPGVTPGHCRMLKSKGVEAQTYYMFKGLINAYRVWAPKRTVVDPQTGEITKEFTGRFEQGKDDLRPGDHARMVRVFANKTIDQLAFAAGRGEALLAAINREALAPFERSEKERSFRCGPPQPLQAHQLP